MTKQAAETKEAENKAPAKEAPVKVERIVQNGVTRPLPETLCGKAWSIADQMSEAKGSPVAVGDLLVETNKVGLNEANVRAEYARWRKFYNITGTIQSEATIAKRKAREEEKAKKEAEREEKRKAKEAEKQAKAEAKAAKEKEKAEAKAKKEAEKAAKAEAKKAEAEAAKQAKTDAEAAKAKADAAKAAKSDTAE